MDVSESDPEDLYEVFNQPPSPVTSTGVPGQLFPPQSSRFEKAAFLLNKMGIQRKQKSTLLDLLESQPSRDAPNKAFQTKLPDLVDQKRKEDKGKKVMEGGKNQPP